jgi:hypothetical protein
LVIWFGNKIYLNDGSLTRNYHNSQILYKKIKVKLHPGLLFIVWQLPAAQFYFEIHLRPIKLFRNHFNPATTIYINI